MMKGEWIILLWALLGIVFLLKTTPIRRLVRNVRRQPSAIQAMVALCLFIAVINGGTKPGGTNEASRASQTEIAAPENSSLIIQQLSLIPSWWNEDSTDTDGDGIPDLWEKWTHGRRDASDDGVDRDGDGLTELEEFQNQTDPRTADTDGDGFDDAFEVANGMDPIVQEDFTPVEPDENQNGIIDLWEDAPYIYSYSDFNNNGFDDTYEEFDLEPASDDNYDVRVDVCTTRSAALTWTVGALTQGIVLPATAMTSVRIRLPFKSDAKIELLAAPEGDALPAGELWRGRLRLSFAPRNGQTAVGTCIVSVDGDIQQKVPESVSAVVRFPGGVPMARTPTSSGGDGLVIDILEKRFEIIPPFAVYHWIGDDAGPFTVTNAVNIDPSAIQWSADFGTMSPSTGGSSTLTVTSIPFDDDEIVVTAEVILDDVFRAVETAIVDLCPGRDFSITDYTSNFSPHLGETASFTLELPGCSHMTLIGWLEGEVMRETTSGMQHVGWVDISAAQPGHQKRRQCLASPQTVFWNGIATEDAALSDSPDMFKEGSAPFHRALPEVVSGEPVPPPYYTILFRYRDADSDTATVIDETSTTVYVPQIVKIEMTDEAYNEFVSPIIYPDTYWPQHIGKTNVNNGVSSVLYGGCQGKPKTEISQEIAAAAQALIPSDVNIRFAMGSVSGRCKHACITTPLDYGTNVLNAYGLTDNEHCSWRNENPFGLCYVFIGNHKSEPCLDKLMTETGALPSESYDPAMFPYDALNLAYALSHSAIHETGHAMGLVNPTYLYGMIGHHNSTTNRNGWIMNDGRYCPDSDRFRKGFFYHPTWKYRNAKYLNFILPCPTP